jgi:hypothetical protein
MTDIPVDPRSWEEIERVAEGWRKVLDPEDLWAPDILALLKRAGLQFEATKGLEVIFLPNAQMGDDEARAEFDPPRIFVR